MIGARASGAPVAGFPVRGPLEVLGPDGCGTGDGQTRPVGAFALRIEDAITEALRGAPEDCVAYARRFSWGACDDQFMAALTSGPDPVRLPAAALGCTVEADDAHFHEADRLGKEHLRCAQQALPDPTVLPHAQKE